MTEKVAVITGAGDGLGKAFATRFVENGYRVVVADINEESGSAHAEALGSAAAFYRCDVTQRDQVEAMIAFALETFSGVDVLVNNAVPPTNLAPVEEKTDEAFQLQLDGSFFAARWAMNAAFDTMRTNGFGRVINLCSLNGVNAHPESADYNVAKEALRALTRTAAREWAPHGITVNAICPGAVTAAFQAMAEFAPQMAERVTKQVPMGYMGDPYRDISGVALFLAGEDARYMTGNTLFVDGGGHINGINWASLFD